MTKKPDSIKESLAKVFDGATVTHAGYPRCEEYIVKYPDNSGYYVAVRSKEFPPKDKTKSGLKANLSIKGRINPFLGRSQSTKFTPALAWIVNNKIDGRSEIVAISWKDFRKIIKKGQDSPFEEIITKDQDSPFQKTLRSVTYRIDCFAKAAEYTEVHVYPKG